MRYENIREGELKNKIAKDYFWLYDCTKEIGNIDFCVTIIQSGKITEQEYLLWAEAKRGIADINISLVQLILTIGKAKTFNDHLPPAYLGAFDAEKIAFLPYSDIHDVFYQNDFNWKVTPSDHGSKEFVELHDRVRSILEGKSLLFYYDRDKKEINRFIKDNFVVGKLGTTKIKIDKNNFISIYNKWLKAVKPSIVVNWEIAKKSGIIDGDFYLADLLSHNNESIKEKLFVLLKSSHYILDRKLSETGMFSSSQANFTDNQKAHTQFWNRYERPPKQEYWDYIVERRDLLVPQDVRERKGSYFTPQIWVELSQKYLTEALGNDWQDEYYIWDCAAGTGNLLSGLTNKYNIWASTLDTQDVEVMKDRIKNGANLLEDHVFQFDFLNDDFSKLPKPLQEIISDEKKRQKLIFYINPPYAEVSSKDVKGKVGVNDTNVRTKYTHILGTSGRELFAQFMCRIYFEINGCIIAEFSKLKLLQGSAFEKFRNHFKASLKSIFLVPANSFDNVKGSFPIGFKIWLTKDGTLSEIVEADVYANNGEIIGNKTIYNIDKSRNINKWISLYKIKEIGAIGYMDGINGNDFQHNNIVYIVNSRNQLPNPRGIWINKDNLLAVAVYFSVRHCVSKTWLNDRDQFLFPNKSWETDVEFKNDSLTYTLFNNNIRSFCGVNHWIPFAEIEVDAREKFDSNFIVDFIKGKISTGIDAPNKRQLSLEEPVVPYNSKGGNNRLEFSSKAMAVFEAGKELWKYYHKQRGCNVNASLYEIREHFQGKNEKGIMNNTSGDAEYMFLISRLRDSIKELADKIAPKVYEHGFLK